MARIGNIQDLVDTGKLPSEYLRILGAIGSKVVSVYCLYHDELGAQAEKRWWLRFYFDNDQYFETPIDSINNFPVNYRQTKAIEHVIRQCDELPRIRRV